MTAHMEAHGLGSRQWATLLEGCKQKCESNMFVRQPSKLAERVWLLVGWGLISWLAEGAVDDGLKQEPVKKLAELGASIMDDIIEHGPLRARSKEKKCEELWMLIQAEHDQQGTTNRIGNLTPSMIKSGEHFPCLATKAAENSHLIPVMAEVCRKLSNGSDADEHRQQLNPMFIWCYPFEDFVGVMILSARNCIAGSPMRIVGRKVIENWCLVSDLTMKHGLEAKMSV